MINSIRVKDFPEFLILKNIFSRRSSCQIAILIKQKHAAIKRTEKWRFVRKLDRHGGFGGCRIQPIGGLFSTRGRSSVAPPTTPTQTSSSHDCTYNLHNRFCTIDIITIIVQNKNYIQVCLYLIN